VTMLSREAELDAKTRQVSPFSGHLMGRERWPPHRPWWSKAAFAS
jgi:hypothetical protein